MGKKPPPYNKKYFPGTIIENNFGEEIEILETKGTHFTIRFTATGHVRTLWKMSVFRGTVRDDSLPKFYPKIQGRNSIHGQKLGETRYFAVWYKMLSRCNNEDNLGYERYGGNGVVVCERWHDFANFYEDITSIDGYDEQRFLNKELQLDKDFRGLKEYSVKGCVFVSRKINATFATIQQRKEFIAIDPNGNKIETRGVNLFAKKNKLNQAHVSACLNGKRKSHKGWKFYFKNEGEDVE